ncbi:3-dehydroquinate synthase [Pontibacillus salicampi]|uniref:3-dehydroquinate synthase n=1 Tax=Pontibacillus salicampi TaxID=1449801 RepID=A0ABV6LLA3_9BACI
MEHLTISTEDSHYPVFIGEGIRHQIEQLLPESYDKIMVITDCTVEELYLKDLEDAISPNRDVFSFAVPAGEKSKQLDLFFECHTKAIENGLNRRSVILALGGGVVGDLAGFVASTFMRGIDYVQIPTTILAHDSSVGGKVAVNHPLGKNMIGNFHQPKAVVYDTQTLLSLPPVEWRSGMAEVMKHAFLADKDMLKQCLQLPHFQKVTNETLITLLKKGIQIKAKYVQKDEKEQGIRRYLNLGHTLGHALEAEAGYTHLSHGEAVAIGMDFALFLSQKYVSNASFPISEYRNWLTKQNYPTTVLENYYIPSLIERMKSDKKNEDEQIRMVLLEEIGKPMVFPFQIDTLQNELQAYRNEVKNF